MLGQRLELVCGEARTAEGDRMVDLGQGDDDRADDLARPSIKCRLGLSACETVRDPQLQRGHSIRSSRVGACQFGGLTMSYIEWRRLSFAFRALTLSMLALCTRDHPAWKGNPCRYDVPNAT